MKGNKGRLLAAALVVAAAAPAMAADADGHRVTLEPEQRRLLNVTTAPARAATSLAVEGLPGEIALPIGSSSAISAPYAGLVAQVLADEGDRVAAGDVLAWLDSRAIADARARWRRAVIERDLARSRAARDRRLHDEGIIPAARAEASAAELGAREAELSAARAALPERTAPTGDAARYALRAPLTGVVVERRVAAGAPLETLEVAFMLLADEGLRLEVQAPLALAGRITPGTPIRIGTTTASVTGRAAAIDPETQTVRVRAALPPAGGYLPGQRVSASIALPAPADAVEIPRAALVRAGASDLVYRADADTFTALAVEVLAETGTQVTVRGTGLAAGDAVVVSGTSALRAMAP